MKHSSFQREGQSWITSRTTEAHQETTWGQIKECRPNTHPDPSQQPRPWNTVIKLLTKSPLGRDTQFWGHEPTVSPFPWQSNKAILFCFTQNSISEIWFSTSAQRPSFSIKLKCHLLCDVLSNSSRPSKFISSVSIKPSTSSYILKHVVLHYDDLLLCLSSPDSK